MARVRKVLLPILKGPIDSRRLIANVRFLTGAARIDARLRLAPVGQRGLYRRPRILERDLK